MNLLEAKTWNLKFIRPLISVVLILSILQSGSGQVTYHFEENFSGDLQEDWVFQNWVNFDTSSQWFGNNGSNHTFTTDDELVSAGEPNGRRVDVAILNDTTSYGVWSVDIFIPSSSIINEVWDSRFFIWTMRSLDFDAEFPADNTGDSYPVFELLGLDELVEFNYHNSGVLAHRTITTDSFRFDTYQHYDLIRTEDRFYLFIDQEFIYSIDLASFISSEIRHFILGTVQGSGVKFDNLRITKDYEEVCIALGCPVPEEDGNPWLQFAIIGGVVVAIAIISGYFYFKKKEMTN